MNDISSGLKTFHPSASNISSAHSAKARPNLSQDSDALIAIQQELTLLKTQVSSLSRKVGSLSEFGPQFQNGITQPLVPKPKTPIPLMSIGFSDDFDPFAILRSLHIGRRESSRPPRSNRLGFVNQTQRQRTQTQQQRGKKPLDNPSKEVVDMYSLNY